MPASQVISGAIVALVLFAITTPPLRHSFRKKDPELVNLVTLALVLKLLASIARYFVAYQIYGGTSDSAEYYRVGSQLAPQFRQLNFHADIGKVIGTGSLKIITGAVFALTGVSNIGGFFVFAWFSFLGLWLFFRAFRIAFPEGNPRTYALLLFFLPSMLFWPSAIGKEGWMTLGLGLMAYGAARVLTRKPLGYTLTLLGAAETAVVRPHVTVLALAAFFVAYLLRRDSTLVGNSRGFGKSAKVLGVLVLSALLIVGVTRAQSFFKSDNLGSGGLTGTLTGTSHRTSEGGSQFKPASFTSPQSIPLAVLSVTFRPFPWEARNIQSLLAAGEGGFLLYLFWRNRRRLKNLPRWMIRRPYLLLCLVYSVLFAFAFSAVGNFGILDRERVQQLPFLLALLALPDFRPDQDPDGTNAAEARPADVKPRVATLSRPVRAERPIIDSTELRPRSPSRLASGSGRSPSP
jgi:hypothetical protein